MSEDEWAKVWVRASGTSKPSTWRRDVDELQVELVAQKAADVFPNPNRGEVLDVLANATDWLTHQKHEDPAEPFWHATNRALKGAYDRALKHRRSQE